MEDSWSPPGRTSPGAASPLVRESRELQWALPQSQRSQHRTTAGATPDPDLVWGFVGRDPATFGIEGWLRMHSPVPQEWAAAADGWRRLGADMVMLYPMYRISNFDGHIEILRRFKEVASG